MRVIDRELVADLRDIVTFALSAAIGFLAVIALTDLPLATGAALGIAFFATVTYVSWKLRFLALAAGVYVGAAVLLVPMATILIARSLA